MVVNVVCMLKLYIHHCYPGVIGNKDARDEDDNIIISDSTLCSLFLPQLKQMSARYKVMCGF